MTIPASQTFAAGDSTTNVPTESVWPGAQNAPYLCDWNKVGQYAVFCVKTNAGVYKLGLRYSAGVGAAVRRIEIDGVGTYPKQIFPATGNWSTWSTVTSTLMLKAGWHTVQVSFDAVSSQYINLDNLTVVAQVTPPPPPPTRTLKATVSATVPGRVDLQEAGFVASDRRRDGGTPNAGDAGWSGAIVGGDAPGRMLTGLQRAVATTYTVGMKDSVKADWVSTSVKVPASSTPPPPPPPPGTAGGKTAVLNALGQQTQHRAWVDGQTARWKNLSGGWSPTWKFNTQVETDLGTAVAEFSDSAAPTTVYRISGSNDSFNGGSRDGDLDSYGRQLQQITQAQGRPQIIRPDYEWDGDWMQWRGEGQVPAFTSAISRIYNRVKANCPTVQLDLCCSLGWGGGTAGINSHRHDLWDAVMNVLGGTFKGGIVTDFDTDAYSNGPPAGTWLRDEQALLLDRAKTWGTRISHGEWGIGDSGLSQAPHNWSVEDWINAWIDWWESLPATGPGSLHHIEIFDLGPWPGPNDFPDGRTFSFAPTNNEGQRAVQAMHARLA